MKVRLLRIHNAKKEFLVSILSKSQKSSEPNPAYISEIKIGVLVFYAVYARNTLPNGVQNLFLVNLEEAYLLNKF